MPLFTDYPGDDTNILHHFVLTKYVFEAVHPLRLERAATAYRRCTKRSCRMRPLSTALGLVLCPRLCVIPPGSSWWHPSNPDIEFPAMRSCALCAFFGVPLQMPIIPEIYQRDQRRFVQASLALPPARGFQIRVWPILISDRC